MKAPKGRCLRVKAPRTRRPSLGPPLTLSLHTVRQSAIADPTARSLFSPFHDPLENDDEPTPPHLPPRNPRFDLVASPDPISNIRKIRVSRPADEHPDEREWRLRREAMVDWHHRFWTDNNLDFFAAKTAFEQSIFERTGNAPTHLEMSEFYKSYLDGAKVRHMEYNRRWWKENFAMLGYSWRGELRRAVRAVKRTIIQSGRDAPVMLPSAPATVTAGAIEGGKDMAKPKGDSA